MIEVSGSGAWAGSVPRTNWSGSATPVARSLSLLKLDKAHAYCIPSNFELICSEFEFSSKSIPNLNLSASFMFMTIPADKTHLLQWICVNIIYFVYRPFNSVLKTFWWPLVKKLQSQNGIWIWIDRLDLPEILRYRIRPNSLFGTVFLTLFHVNLNSVCYRYMCIASLLNKHLQCFWMSYKIRRHLPVSQKWKDSFRCYWLSSLCI